MELILTKTVKHLGKKDQLVEVKPGYGRNYLIPKGCAILADAANKKHWEEIQRQRQHKHQKELKEAQALAHTMGQLTLKIPTKASEKGSIYGSVTATQVVDALKKEGHVVERKQVIFKEPIKTLGDHTVAIELHKQVEQEVTILVLEEGE